ncbi:24001_t:CDS:2, partial [Gigaspora margarita]
NVTTSRAEGAYAMLKMYLQVSVDNLHIVHEKISLAIENQYKEIKTIVAQEMIRIPQAQNKLFYAQVVTKVSTFALKKVYEQFQIASNTTPESPLQPCSALVGLATITSAKLPETNNSLQQKWEEYSQQFNSLTLYQKNAALDKMPSLFQESTTTIQDPQVQPTRGRPVGAKN